MKKNKYEIDMCNGTLMDKLISFAIPLMLSGILQLMFNAVDIIVVGRFSGSQSLAAVGSTTALINVFTNLFIGISLGANVLAARYYALEKSKEMSETVHTAIAFALISGVGMAVIGLLMAKPALELMGTPDDVIAKSTLYMRIYFCGMPFFMLYNYGAAILRAVGDTKRPLIFLLISGVINAILNLFLVIQFHLDVAGVGIATVISQLISCILVLRCLYCSESSYQFRPEKLNIRSSYLRQIFEVGIPAGIQSTVINLSNAMLQSSVNSFGSISMAGYTAANNIFGFLYVSINSVTQACMSFTSQNYGVKKLKRMDRVLIDCAILSVVVALGLGSIAYFFGTRASAHLQRTGGCDCLWYGDSVLHNHDLFPVRSDGSVPGGFERNGLFHSAYDPVYYRNRRHADSLDLWTVPDTPVTGIPVYLISGFLDRNHCDAGDLLLVCEKKDSQGKRRLLLSIDIIETYDS